jgi:holo-[acyl-carrier protein] synthase
LIAGLGLDVVALGRFRGLVEPGAGNTPSRFVAATFTAEEVRYCQQEALGDAVEHLAVRFAAKEAALKALDAAAAAAGQSPGTIALACVEVRRDARGRPSLALSGDARKLFVALELTAAHVSLSHDGDVVAATVIMER